MSTLLLYASCLETFQGTYTISIFFTIFTKLLPLLCHIFKYINKTTYNIYTSSSVTFQSIFHQSNKNYRFFQSEFFNISSLFLNAHVCSDLIPTCHFITNLLNTSLLFFSETQFSVLQVLFPLIPLNGSTPVPSTQNQGK